MGKLVPSKYQQAIIDYYKNNPHDNIFITAYAGGSKSTTLLMLSEFSTTSDIYVAFNNSVAKEFEKKITNPKVKSKTIHSVAYAIMQYNVGKSAISEADRVGFGKKEKTKNGPEKVQLDNFKITKIVDGLVDLYHGENCNFEFRVWLKNNYSQLYNLCRVTLTSFVNESKISELMADYQIFSENDDGFFPPDIKTVIKWLEEIHRLSSENFENYGYIDFTDMLFITYEKLCSKEWTVPGWSYYTNIFQDECQDMSVLHLQFLKLIKRKGGRYIFVGDYHQCQPIGTKIHLINGEIKNIEDLEFNDKVIQYSTDRGNFMSANRSGTERPGFPETKRRKADNSFVGVNSKGNNQKIYFEVIDKQRFYVDKTIKITTEKGLQSSYTTNHNCYVKFNREKCQNAVSLYLMERYDGIFRIGIVHMYASQTSLGIKQRARSEGFDRCWILNIYDTFAEAWTNEQKYSLKYQIPQLIFQFEKVSYSPEQLQEIYDGVLSGMRGRAIALLEEFGRDINYPLWTRNDINSHTARDHCFITQASNIIPNYMDALIFDETNRRKEGKGAIKSTYDNITNVETITGLQEVIGITTSMYHNYVADGILTHNSIYHFNGANAQSFNLIKKMFAPVKEFDLPICYRCPKSHLKRVNEEYNIPILPRDNAPEGFIKTIKNNEIKEYIQPGDMIISRKNKYLPEVILQMSIAGIPIYIEDKDFVDRVKKIAKKTKLNSLKSLENNINKSVNRAKENILNLETFQKETEGMTKEEQENLAQEKAESNSQVDSSLFLLKIIDSYLNKYPMASVEEFRIYLDKLLNTYPRPDAVRICSIHKAKGLEADNVFVLNEAKYEYLPFASPEQNQQEKNLSYIATTRARNGLYLVKLSDLTQAKEDRKKAHSLEKILNKKKAQKVKGRK